ncbi:MAG: response regulator transcription factor [Chloroflexi bacterium]|nr:response regulator transcription factor [Chloroflexota bacterium]
MGRKEADNQEVIWLQSGADDYIYYPLGSAVLQARLKALLRQMQRVRMGFERDLETRSAFTIDCENRQAVINGKRIHLNQRETIMLGFLAQNPHQVYSRAELLHQAWGATYEGSDRVVDMMIHRLRTKLELNQMHPQHLVTVRGAGYRFDA